jgi:hypothetical protein
MPCMEMKELEASCSRYAERRLESVRPKFERRKVSPGRHRVAQAQMAYLIRVHLQNCAECRRDGYDSQLPEPFRNTEVS